MLKSIQLAALFVGTSIAAGSPVESTFADLPTPVHDRLLELFENQLPVTSPERFNPGDVVRVGMSSRMVVLVAKHDKLYLVHYVHGGRGKHSHLVGIYYDGDAASPVLNVVLDQYESIAKVQEALSQFAFRTAGEY